jgi:hypothetical protein
MTNENIYVIYEVDGGLYDDDTWEIHRLDQSGNKLSTEYSISDANSNLQNIFESPQYVYIYDTENGLVQFSKNGDGNLTKEWTVSVDIGKNLTFADNGDPLFVGFYSGGNEIARYSVADGSTVWSTTYDTSNLTPQDITVLGDDNLVVVFNAGDLIREYDGESGEITNELTHSYPRGISRDENDNYVITDQGKDVTKMDRDGNIIWTMSIETRYIDQLYRGLNRYYAYDTDNGFIYAITDAGSLSWKRNLSSVEYMSVYKTQNDKEHITYVSSNDTVYGLDGDTGNDLWTGVSGNRYEDIVAYPEGTSFRELWFPSVTVSGTANLQGSGVEGADILVIDDDRNIVADRVQTDLSGNWSTEVRDNTLHILAQYTDADGNVYNTESYPYVNSN